MRNKAMLIGAVRAGKSTLTNALLGRKVEAFKTQTLNYYDWIVDTPGEYSENPMFYKNIMATALEVTHVLYIQDATSEKLIFPPGFSMGIPKIPIGVITKCDLKEADADRALDMLKTVMNEGPIVMISSVTGMGIDHLRELTKMDDLEAMRQYVETNANEHLLFLG
ncbi:50S ribosome-binding GTPase [Sporosarcina sp. GW1-11]|uniref:EutP/PduV family microcompartment system protein n=1 Tax=Sporosarcina sp. GW1-11 TaxID=2899126 RepID=UPI00294E5344|nr:EutP/PduV family microcompartment system protein [Sporosarcina sp. GW1-11]MDV6379368.1 50S ribosome-binding GTPase [Sporosarcina sp. GW1-11]